MCKYCKKDNDENLFYEDRDDNDYLSVWIMDNKLNIHTNRYGDEIVINYCPICGRKLDTIN